MGQSLNFHFTFTNDPGLGTVPGTITGEIIGLLDNSTSSAAALIIDTIPSTFNLPGATPFNLLTPSPTNYSYQVIQNSFHVSNGQITSAELFESVYSPQDRFGDEFGLNLNANFPDANLFSYDQPDTNGVTVNRSAYSSTVTFNTSATTIGTSQGPSAAADWFQFAAIPQSITTTNLVPSTDPNGGGEMLQVIVSNGGQLGNTFGNGIGQQFAAAVAGANLNFDILVTSGQVTAGLVSTSGPFAIGSETFYASPNWQHFSERAGSADGVYFETLTSSPSSAEFFVDNVVALDTSAPSSTNLLINGSFDATVATPCYCTGTLILTERGEMPVEELAIGDKMVTVSGGIVPISWIGRRKVAARFADPRTWPVRIKANALADGVPSRDLCLSPDHALLVADVLIQAGALVNGVSIVRDTNVPQTFTYYHVELDDHSLILAENTPSETFVDNVDRLGFDNWEEHEALYPEGKPIVEMPYPRAKAHRQVPRATRMQLAKRALSFCGSTIEAAAANTTVDYAARSRSLSANAADASIAVDRLSAAS